MVRSAALAARLEPWPGTPDCGAAAQCDAGGAHAEPVPGRREAPIRVLCAPYAPACRVRKGAGTAPCARVPAAWPWFETRRTANRLFTTESESRGATEGWITY